VSDLSPLPLHDLSSLVGDRKADLVKSLHEKAQSNTQKKNE
jgi:hypothetical protein